MSSLRSWISAGCVFRKRCCAWVRPERRRASVRRRRLGLFLEKLGRLEHHLRVVEAEQSAAGQSLKADRLARVGGDDRLVVRDDDLIVDELVELGDGQGQIAHVLGRRGLGDAGPLLVMQAEYDRAELQQVAQGHRLGPF